MIVSIVSKHGAEINKDYRDYYGKIDMGKGLGHKSSEDCM
jgi:hypothetical protein